MDRWTADEQPWGESGLEADPAFWPQSPRGAPESLLSYLLPSGEQLADLPTPGSCPWVLLPHTAFRKLSVSTELWLTVPTSGRGSLSGLRPGACLSPSPAPPRRLPLETSASAFQESRQVGVGPRSLPPPTLPGRADPEAASHTSGGRPGQALVVSLPHSQGQDWPSPTGLCGGSLPQEQPEQNGLPWGSGGHADWLGQPPPCPCPVGGPGARLLPLCAQRWQVQACGSRRCLPGASTWDRRGSAARLLLRAISTGGPPLSLLGSGSSLGSVSP